MQLSVSAQSIQYSSFIRGVANRLIDLLFLLIDAFVSVTVVSHFVLESGDRKEKDEDVNLRERVLALLTNVAPLLPGRQVTCDAIPDAESCDGAKT